MEFIREMAKLKQAVYRVAMGRVARVDSWNVGLRDCLDARLNPLDCGQLRLPGTRPFHGVEDFDPPRVQASWHVFYQTVVFIESFNSVIARSVRFRG